MKLLALPVAVAAMVLMLAQNTQSVLIKYEGLQVKLESVKKLDELLEQPGDPSPQMRMEDPLSLCSNPQLPSDLQPVCKTPNAADTFKALRSIAQDDCELCVNVACTGCY
ncbi:guanylate cyclase activator 2B [Trichosurus vulpecula]|uniref:guanylate cyclase activator 2B n=1 Tax=Trichosurus vulpecula TaxID=9337 RepID=UPI00186AD7DA|nr:guanylate cyclase activator 2B [Trichosurus vulpecula]